MKKLPIPKFFSKFKKRLYPSYKTPFGLNRTTTDCPKCEAPRGLIGWLCGHGLD